MKIIREIFFLLIGICAGAITVAFDIDGEVREVIGLFVDKMPDKAWTEYIKLGEYQEIKLGIGVVLFVVLGMLLVCLIRLFINSKTVNRWIEIQKWLTYILVGVPASAILLQFEKLLFKNMEPERQAIISVCLVYVVARILSLALSSSFARMLKQPVKNCVLQVCTAMNAEDYQVTDTLTKKLTYQYCFNFMRNREDELRVREFYRIIEMPVLGHRIIDEWKYYRDGNVIRDNDYLKKLISVGDTSMPWNGSSEE